MTTIDLGTLVRRALNVDRTVRVDSWGLGLARKAVVGAARRDPALAFQLSQWARCAWAGDHEWPADAKPDGPATCVRCCAERGAINLLDLLAGKK